MSADTRVGILELALSAAWKTGVTESVMNIMKGIRRGSPGIIKTKHSNAEIFNIINDCRESLDLFRKVGISCQQRAGTLTMSSSSHRPQHCRAQWRGRARLTVLICMCVLDGAQEDKQIIAKMRQFALKLDSVAPNSKALLASKDVDTSNLSKLMHRSVRRLNTALDALRSNIDIAGVEASSDSMSSRGSLGARYNSMTLPDKAPTSIAPAASASTKELLAMLLHK